MIDLHTHSRYSDGDWTVARVVAEAAQRGLAGISLTDHNGVWGAEEAATAAAEHGMLYVQGIEISCRFQEIDVHMLGYARSFNQAVLSAGLADTRAGYRARVQEMVERCQAAGYPDINFAAIAQERSTQKDPNYISYDVAQQLMRVYGISWNDARRLTVRDGTCYVPYGAWALEPAAAIAIIHAAGGRAFLAHPGITIHEASRRALDTLLSELLKAKLDGVEAYHPFHDEELTEELEKFCARHALLLSGGSDWHGPGRYHAADFGSYGVAAEVFQRLLDTLA